MADKMTRAEKFCFFSFPQLKINGALFSEVNGIIAQGNNQQMEYAKWNPEEGGRGTEGKGGGRQTKTDWGRESLTSSIF